MGLFVKPDTNNVQERECGCCIKIEDSFVLIICGEIDINNLKSALKTFVEVKGNATLEGQE
jgi:hypothetical protein